MWYFQPFTSSLFFLFSVNIFFFFYFLQAVTLGQPSPSELGKNLICCLGYVKSLELWNLWTSCLKKNNKNSSVFFPPVADWQDFLSTCPTARKTPYLGSFAVDNQQEISPQFYWSLTIVGHLVLTEAVNHMQNLTIAWQQETYVRLLVTLSCKHSIVYAYAILAHMHSRVLSKTDTCSTLALSPASLHTTLYGLKLFLSSSPAGHREQKCLSTGNWRGSEVTAQENSKFWGKLGSAMGICANSIRQCFKF